MRYRLRQVEFINGRMQTVEDHGWVFAALISHHIGAFDDKSTVPARSTAIILEVFNG